MKTFLVPTDFSDAAKNAAAYAVDFARQVGAKVILFHAYHIPPVAVDAAVIIPSPAELGEQSMKGLQQIRGSFLEKPENNGLHIDCVCEYGFAVDEIIRYAELAQADLIIMGMQGAGWLSEKLLGSITTAVMRESKCPVLAVGESMKFVLPRKIVLAYDYKSVRNEVLAPLLNMAELFNSKIYILNVDEDRKSVQERISDTQHNVQLDRLFENTEHTFHYRTADDLAEAINRFAERYGANLVVTIPREHSFLTNLFREPSTKQVAFHSKVPLLSLHE